MIWSRLRFSQPWMPRLLRFLNFQESIAYTLMSFELYDNVNYWAWTIELILFLDGVKLFNRYWGVDTYFFPACNFRNHRRNASREDNFRPRSTLRMVFKPMYVERAAHLAALKKYNCSTNGQCRPKQKKGQCRPKQKKKIYIFLIVIFFLFILADCATIRFLQCC